MANGGDDDNDDDDDDNDDNDNDDAFDSGDGSNNNDDDVGNSDDDDGGEDTAFIQESNLGFHTLATYSSYLYASFVTHPFPFLKAVLNAKDAIIHPGVLF